MKVADCRATENAAREKKIGLWKGGNAVKPYEWRKTKEKMKECKMKDYIKDKLIAFACIIPFAIGLIIAINDSDYIPCAFIGLVITAVCLCGWLSISTKKLEEKESAESDAKTEREREKLKDEYFDWHSNIESQGTIEAVESSIILGKDEVCLRVEQYVTMHEVRSVRHSVHTYGSIPIGKTRARIGRGYSTSKSTDEWTPISVGNLYITNKQIYFDGNEHDRKIKLKDIVTLKAGWSAIEISTENRQKSMIFSDVNGRICNDIIRCALGNTLCRRSEYADYLPVGV